MEHDKVKAVLEAPPPQNAKALSRFLGQIKCHDRMIRHIADFATPFHATFHRELFTWTEEEDKAFIALKLLLSRASVVQPLDWEREFLVFLTHWTLQLSTY
jgi:hypothetical protein